MGLWGQKEGWLDAGNDVSRVPGPKADGRPWQPFRM